MRFLHSAALCPIAAMLLVGLTQTRALAADPNPADHRGDRIVYETVGGGIATTVGLVAGVGFCATAGGGGGRGGAGAVIGTLQICGVAGGLMFQSVGVYAAGHWAGGNGSYKAALGGELLGIGLALAPLAVAQLWNDHPPSEPKNNYGLTILHFAVLPLVGGIVGYELSTHQTEQATTVQQGLSPAPTWLTCSNPILTFR